MRSWCVGKVVRLVVVVGVLAVGLGFVGVSGAAAQTVADIEVRDRLVADQEALLNVYRCMFGVDVEVVPGGCADGAPALPAKGPAPFAGVPTAGDLAVRDQLVADQEALLNVYRCQFNIDTGLVPDGCPDTAPTAQTEPEEVDEPETTPTGIQCRIVYAPEWIGSHGELGWKAVCNRYPDDTRHLCEVESPGNRIYVTLELVVCGVLGCPDNTLESWVGGTEDTDSWYSVCAANWADVEPSPMQACPIGYVPVWEDSSGYAYGLIVSCISSTHDIWQRANWQE